MSERSSFGRNRGYSAVTMFKTKNNRITSRVSSGYVLKGRRVSSRRELKMYMVSPISMVPLQMRLTMREINSPGTSSESTLLRSKRSSSHFGNQKLRHFVVSQSLSIAGAASFLAMVRRRLQTEATPWAWKGAMKKPSRTRKTMGRGKGGNLVRATG